MSTLRIVVPVFTAITAGVAYILKKRKKRVKRECAPFIIPPPVIGFVARKLIDEIEKGSSMEKRVAHLKYKLEQLENETGSIREALEYIYEKDHFMVYVRPEKPNEFMQCLEWIADHMKCF